MGNLVPYRKTNLSDLEFAKILQQGYKLAFGKEPTLEVLGCAWAQACLECGRPVSLPNNNIGNIKAGFDWIKNNDYFVKDTEEFTKDGKRYIQNSAKWRAYSSPIEGAVNYWKLLVNNYKDAIDWMAAGDSESASVALGLGGYYTANIKKYATATGVLYKEFFDKIAPSLNNLFSNPAPAPAEKLPIKNRAIDYNKDDVTKQDDAVDMLGKKLYSNRLTKLVKNSILKEKLPLSEALICINGDNHTNNLEFARIASNLLKKFIDANVSVCGDDKCVELYCSGLGSEKLFIGAVNELCSLILKKMNSSVKSKVSFLVLSGMLSKYGRIEDSKLIVNNRVFNLNRICYECC